MGDSRDLENKKEGLGTVDFWASLFQVTPEQFEEAVGDNSETVSSGETGGGDAILKSEVFPDSNNDQQNGGNVINNPQDLGKQVGLETGTQATPIDLAMAAKLKINSREVMAMRKQVTELDVKDVPIAADIFKVQLGAERDAAIEQQLKERVMNIVTTDSRCKHLYKSLVKVSQAEADKTINKIVGDMYLKYGSNNQLANRKVWAEDITMIDDDTRKELKSFDIYIPNIAKDEIEKARYEVGAEEPVMTQEAPAVATEVPAEESIPTEDVATAMPGAEPAMEKEESLISKAYYNDLGKFYFGELKSGDTFRFDNDKTIYAVKNVDKSKQIVATQSDEDNFVFSLDELNEEVIHKLSKVIAKEDGYKLFDKVKFVDEEDEVTKGKIGYVININSDVPDRVKYVIAWGINGDANSITADEISSLPADMMVAIDEPLTEEETKKVKEVSEEYEKIVSNPEGQEKELEEEKVELEACNDKMSSYAAYIKSNIDLADIGEALREELALGEDDGDVNAVVEGYIPDVFSQIHASDKSYNKHMYISAIRKVLNELADRS